ncbi:hypothetical protein [Aeromonas media]|uniref:hypothetical protein n=1 Tax=Aeromonas media TaxID=651 RepID=UPI003D1EC004
MKKRIVTCSIAMAVLLSSQSFAEQYEFRLNADGVGLEKPIDLTGEACREIQSKNPTMSNGVYELTINGEKIPVYCNDGWTLVAAQFESNPVMWTGNMTNYDPSLSSQRSFAIPEGKLPKHSSFAVGRGTDILIHALNRRYSTGNIGRTVVGDIDGSQYLVHRLNSDYYPAHNPDNTLAGSFTYWNNTLTVELYKTNPQKGSVLSPKNDFTWAFSPLHPDTISRGYAIDGTSLQSTLEKFAWTVWVK